MKHCFFLATLVLLFASLQRTAAQDKPVCKDDPKFKFKNKQKKNCAYFANGDGKWRNKWCKKKAIKLACPETCDSCDKLKPPKDVCPKTKKDKILQGSCKMYKPGLECKYGYIWKGCNDNAQMMCMPIYESTCDPAKLSWLTKAEAIEKCEPFADDRPYGKKCKTDSCPPVAPESGDSCEWYTNQSEKCYYDYLVMGCNDEPKTCSPTKWATCDSETQTWFIAQAKVKCSDGTTCDPDTYFEGCPKEKPTDGSDCETPFPFSLNTACVYEYSVGGCGNNPKCLPVSRFYCTKKNKWKEVPDKRPKCLVSEGCPQGECDPDDFDPTCNLCPDKAPKPGSLCWETSDEGCSYDYSVEGCTPEDLKCKPGSTYTCGADGLWEVEYHYYPEGLECVAPEGCPRGECDPNDFDPTCNVCPEKAPEPETPCWETAEDCSYDYSVSGCTVDQIQCSPDSKYYCGTDGMWKVENYYRPACVAPEGCPWGKCDPEDFDPTCSLCPDKKPQAGKTCETPFPFEDACVYEYSVGGCKGSLECRPVSYFYCNKNNDQWKEVPDRRVKCGIPKGCPRGKCDPDDFNPKCKKPKPKSFLV